VNWQELWLRFLSQGGLERMRPQPPPFREGSRPLVQRRPAGAVRGLLSFDVGLDDLERCSTSRHDGLRRGPEVLAPQCPLGPALLTTAVEIICSSNVCI
jgi:hypothetical protein